MSYFRITTDASHMYHDNAAAATSDQTGTAVAGNLADFVKNSVAIRYPHQILKVEYYRSDVRTNDPFNS